VKIDFYRHSINEQDIERVNTVLRKTFLTMGEEVKSFENDLADYLGCKHVIGVNSCTAALHLSLLACNIGPGDEVITTPMTFISTANTILHVGATPVFIDVEKDTGNMNVNNVEAAITSKTKAIMPIHLYGQMCDMRALRQIANAHKLLIIEDAAHSLESVRDGIRPGQLGDTACFSFYATKNITSGEGGAVSTNSEEIADKLRLLRLHGMNKGAADRYTKKYEHWDMLLCGWKYNMDNIQAALLIGQLQRVESLLIRRQEIVSKYVQAFSIMKGVSFPAVRADSKSARHLFTIWVDPSKRDLVLARLQDAGIGVAVNFRAIHLLTYYANTLGYSRGSLPISERIGDSTITLPLYPGLTDEEVEYVIKAVVESI